MLQTLKSYSLDFTQKVLVVLSERFIKEPLGDKANFGIDSSLIDSVLEEIKKKIHIRENELSEKSKSKILNYISEEISSITLTPHEKQKAKERLGQKGLLPIKDYRLVQTGIYPLFDWLGTKASSVTDAFINYDKYYHVENPRTPITFFSKLIKTTRQEDTFILLVITSRESDILAVRGAWRLYLTDLNISEDYNISNLFEVFLDRYGILVRTESTDWTKLIWYDVSRYRSNQNIEIWNQKNLGENRTLRIATRKYLPTFGMYEAFCIYTVDIEKYIVDLIKHGAIGNELLDKDKYPIGRFHIST